MASPGKHPDDPAEGSRETIERELARQSNDGKREARSDQAQDIEGATKQTPGHRGQQEASSTGASPQPGPGDEIRADQDKPGAGDRR